ncbi:Thioredoxin-like protein 4B [Zostera marina]|uniref:Thioredoxin-like protein 4B n=1 Tax=Zostera marina TaxID=29655 RepID=A0A0K9PZT5_ZOSMR|nr:Thioredoxin-like protein 4B [Zostera marina]
MGSFVLPTMKTKREVDTFLMNTLDKVAVLRFSGKYSPSSTSNIDCVLLDDILCKVSREVSKFAEIALVDADAEEIQVYVKYFDITLFPSTVFFFNTYHMKMNSGSADHTKWVGSFHSKQDFIDVVEVIFRGAMNGKLIVGCPLPPDRIPKFQLLFNDI